MGSALRSGLSIPIQTTADDFEGLDPYVTEILRLGPLAYWRMNDASGLPQDSSPNALHMTAVSGSPTYAQTGPIDPTDTPAADAILEASAGYHERAIVSTAQNNMALVAYIRRHGATSVGGDLFTQGSTSGGWQIEFTNTAGAMRGNLPGVGTLGGAGTLVDNTWHHCVFQRNAGTWQAFLDGVFASSSFGSANPGVPVGNIRLIGGAASGVDWAHAAYFDRVFSTLEVARLYMIATRTLVTP